MNDLLKIDRTPETDFGWIRAGLYSLGVLALWLVLALVTSVMAHHVDWIRGPSQVSAPLAVVFGCCFELMRRSRARSRS